MNEILRKTPRSKRFMSWLFLHFDWCQRCQDGRARDVAHPFKRRPWGGGKGMKGSDLGALMLCRPCHDLEIVESYAWKGRERDGISIVNMCEYAASLDPTCDLLSELCEQAQIRVLLLEEEQG